MLFQRPCYFFLFPRYHYISFWSGSTLLDGSARTALKQSKEAWKWFRSRFVLYTTVIDLPIYLFVFPLKEEFKCYSCMTDSENNCKEPRERVCKQKNPFCMTVTGSAYILQCADNGYYNALKQYCDDTKKCQVSSCTESLCNSVISIKDTKKHFW